MNAFSVGAWSAPSSKVVLPPNLPRPALCSAQIAAFGAENKITQFLNRSPVIRIGITHAPNFGHQMSSLIVAERLRELGYENELQFIFEPYTEAKLAALVPGFDPSYTVQALPGRRTFISQEYFRSQPEDFFQAKLAMMGAEDEVSNSRRLPNRPTRPEDLRSDVLIRLQPTQWMEGSQTITTASGASHSLEDLLPLAYLTSFPPALVLPNAGLIPIDKLEKLLDPRAPWETTAFYNAHTDRVPTLTHYSEALLSLPGAFTSQLRGPIVVPVLSEFSDFNFQNLNLALEANPVTRGKTILVRAGEALRVEAGKLTVAFLPSLPPPMINRFYRLSTLPPAVTGKFSRGQLLEMGVPFLEIRFDDILDILAPQRSGPQHQLILGTLIDFREELPSPDRVRSRGVGNITRFIELSRTPDGQDLRELFARGFHPDLTQDKTVQALLRAMAFLGDD